MIFSQLCRTSQGHGRVPPPPPRPCGRDCGIEPSRGMDPVVDLRREMGDDLVDEVEDPEVMEIDADGAAMDVDAEAGGGIGPLYEV